MCLYVCVFVYEKSPKEVMNLGEGVMGGVWEGDGGLDMMKITNKNVDFFYVDQ